MKEKKCHQIYIYICIEIMCRSLNELFDNTPENEIYLISNGSAAYGHHKECNNFHFHIHFLSHSNCYLFYTSFAHNR